MSEDSDSFYILSRGIPLAIADAILEHESWLSAWQRAALCGLPPGRNVIDEAAHLSCRFGQWFEYHKATGMLDGKLFADLDRAHRETHEAARGLAAKRAAGEHVTPDEYDALMDAAANFRKIAVRVQELHGRPDEGALIAEDDDLAELQSRLTMLSELEREWERATRTGQAMSLLLVCPEGLAAVRRDYGQIGIDRVVASVAARLFSHLRPYDSVFRYGRTEFLICLPGTDRDRAMSVAERLQDLLGDDPVALSEDGQSTVTARFGIAVSDPKVPVQELFDRASRAVATAQAGGGNRIVVWSEEG